MVGGLLALLLRKGAPVRIIAVTNGAALRSDSSADTAQSLRSMRPSESRAALRCLGMVEHPLRLNLVEGETSKRPMRLAERLCGLIDRRDVVFSP
jgi:LmbE family N-acetylglucosaminyl deacetylase